MHPRKEVAQARNVEQTVQSELNAASHEFDKDWASVTSSLDSSSTTHSSSDGVLGEPPLDYKHPKKNWRLKRGAMPQWYKQRHGIRAKAQSGAARVARFRPRSRSVQ